MKPPRTAVLGATGFLGRYLLAVYRAFDPPALGTARRPSAGLAYLDLAGPDIAPLQLRQQGYAYAVIAAAVTRVDQCEAEPEASWRCNVTGTLELARQLTTAGIVPIWFSSDYVFDGTDGPYSEDSPLNPINAYGRQKAEVEKCLPEVCQGQYLIVRLSKVFGLQKGDGTLLDEMANRLWHGQGFRAARDQIFSPVLADDVVAAILELQTRGSRGLVQVCAPESWSRLELAQALAQALGRGIEGIAPISLAELQPGLQRPKRTDMRPERIRQLGCRFTPLADCIRQVAQAYREELHEVENHV